MSDAPDTGAPLKRRRDLLRAGGAFALGPLAALVAPARDARAEGGDELSALRARGVLRVAVYKDFAPFSDDGRGIDIDLAQALAAALGVRADVLAFEAEEKVEDDLRNMVWRGTLLGYGPADLMLHAPVDPVFAERNPQARLFGPYFRDRLQLARSLSRIPRLDTLDGLRGEAIGAEDNTLASFVLLSVDGGRLAGSLQHYHSTGQALQDLKAGRLSAVMGLRSELQYGMAGAEGFALTDPAAPGIPAGGWRLGMAVRSGREALAGAVESALGGLIADGSVEKIFRKFNVAWSAP